MREVGSKLLLFLCIGLLSFFIVTIAEDRDTYKEEVIRQEKVIREQHGKLCMLDGILRNEIKQFTLEWVDLEGTVLRRRD